MPPTRTLVHAVAGAAAIAIAVSTRAPAARSLSCMPDWITTSGASRNASPPSAASPAGSPVRRPRTCAAMAPTAAYGSCPRLATRSPAATRSNPNQSSALPGCASAQAQGCRSRYDPTSPSRQ